MNKELELEAEKFGYGKNGIMSDEAKAFIQVEKLILVKLLQSYMTTT